MILWDNFVYFDTRLNITLYFGDYIYLEFITKLIFLIIDIFTYLQYYISIYVIINITLLLGKLVRFYESIASRQMSWSKKLNQTTLICIVVSNNQSNKSHDLHIVRNAFYTKTATLIQHQPHWYRLRRWLGWTNC